MHNEQYLVRIKDVDASLSYGKIYSSGRWNIVVVLLAILGISALVVASIGLIDVQSDKTLLLSAIMGYVIGGVSFLAALLLGLYISRGRRKAKLFLQDAILLNARAEALGTQFEVRYPAIAMSAVALRVKFRYHDRKIVKDSTWKGSGFHLVVFKKYADREIKIAYSPKYDEVLLLKSR